MTQRVAIIGAGPCGLSQLHAFRQAQEQGAEIPEIVCFEKRDDWGGLWNYNWRTGLDEHGEPVHGSMYRYLWSNGPKECLEFADYSFDRHFGKPVPSFPPRESLADYIFGRAENSGIKEWIEFNTIARDIVYDTATKQFRVTLEELVGKTRRTEIFDYVIVATGHYSTPHVPHFDGIDTFPGRVLHAHDFRDAQEFAGKDLLLVGASYSAEDIGLQCKKYGANSVTMTWRTKPMGFKWPDGVEERPLLQKFDGNTAHFKDGSSKEVDAILLCTGYLHHFPFLEDGLKLRTHNRLYPPNLYKLIFWQDNPQLMYLGMMDQYFTFSMFDAQAWYARDVILGRIKLPTHDEMARESAEWVKREEALENPHQDIDFQADYIRDLFAPTDYPKFDIDQSVENFNAWEQAKDDSIVGYRNTAYRSAVTGTMAAQRPRPWWEEMDDSSAGFAGEPATA